MPLTQQASCNIDYTSVMIIVGVAFCIAIVRIARWLSPQRREED